MKGFVRFALGVLLFGLAICPAQAAFTSIHIFGDSISNTTNGISGYPTNYYGQRWSNGRVWVELLAQEQGLTNNYWYSNNIANHVSYTNLSASSTNWFYSSNNWSYYGDYSTNVVKTLTSYPAPPDLNTALFVVWVNDADFVYDTINYSYPTDKTQWTNAINLSLTNHFKIITNLYAKGIRTLIMPNAVDLSEVPIYQNNAAATNGFIRQQVKSFNTAFTTILSNEMVSLPGLKIYEPDFFSLLDNIMTNAAAYGLTNAGTDAMDDLNLMNLSMNGPGANYIWWDNQDPTAKVHEIMADVAQQLISPVQISKITSLTGSNRLDVANMPVGLNGIVLGRTNFVLGNWTTNATFNSTNATQSVFVTPSGPVQFYRLSFPFAWTWP